MTDLYMPLELRNPNSLTVPCISIQLDSIQLDRTKTGNADDEGRVYQAGPLVEALQEWLKQVDTEKSGLPPELSIGGGRGAGAHAAVDQPDRQTEVDDGRARPKGVLGTWLKGGISHRGSAAGRSAGGGNAIAAAPVCSTGGKLLR